jgi:hypothetical protein
MEGYRRKSLIVKDVFGLDRRKSGAPKGTILELSSAIL